MLFHPNHGIQSIGFSALHIVHICTKEIYLSLSTLAMVPDRKDFIGQKKGKTSKKKRKTSTSKGGRA